MRLKEGVVRAQNLPPDLVRSDPRTRERAPLQWQELQEAVWLQDGVVQAKSLLL